ncbi:MAG TPA: hypothetical protein VK555_11540 [Terriglobales bacterium]|jgi:hypothetical protein|nr:hypothetical protein [Terriglobales bacterium]
MSDELNLHREHEEVAYEREDLSPRGIFAFLIVLALVGVLVHFAVKGMYGYLDAYQKQHQPPLNPLVNQTETDSRKVSNSDIARFPQPRLETNERLEINDFRLQEEKDLNSYGWIDQKAGIARIPIERAMQLLAQRGLPTRPQAGAVPPSPVNMARQAATRSNISQPKPRKKGKEVKQ